jgi:hypothetical protein
VPLSLMVSKEFGVADIGAGLKQALTVTPNKKIRA